MRIAELTDTLDKANKARIERLQKEKEQTEKRLKSERERQKKAKARNQIAAAQAALNDVAQ